MSDWLSEILHPEEKQYIHHPHELVLYDQMSRMARVLRELQSIVALMDKIRVDHAYARDDWVFNSYQDLEELWDVLVNLSPDAKELEDASVVANDSPE